MRSDRRPAHPRVRLLAATEPLLDALTDDLALFGELVGSPVPDGWPEFPEAISRRQTIAQYKPKGAAAKAVKALAEELLGRIAATGSQAQEVAA